MWIITAKHGKSSKTWHYNFVGFCFTPYKDNFRPYTENLEEAIRVYQRLVKEPSRFNSFTLKQI